ncbi:MAG: YeiH family protein [Thermodesulfobium sp.]
MSNSKDDVVQSAPPKSRWTDLYLKEDWWAIWLGLFVVLAAYFAFTSGSSFVKAIAINPGGLKWDNVGQIFAHLGANAPQYIMQYVFWLIFFTISTAIMGVKPSKFIPSFTLLYIFSIIIFAIGGWKYAQYFNLEPPLVALVLGLLLANVLPIPRWLDDGFRVEYYIKTGIVLLGATFPIALVVSAGPVALTQATVISVITCLTIFFVGTKYFKLDKRFATILGMGGAICGVSAAMAGASAVGAKKEHLYSTVTLVVIAALIMIIVLPFVSKALGLPAGVAGAWIGTSEFADAAGFAAAVSYGHMVGNETSALHAFTLMKVIGRDMWIGIWSFVFALIACMKWEKEECGVAPSPMEIWWRFPKFVIGFFVASIIMTLVTSGYSAAEFAKSVNPNLIAPISSLRTWTFIFCFASIGLTTRFKDLKSVGWAATAAFSIGVVVNVFLGWFMSTQVFYGFWSVLK